LQVAPASNPKTTCRLVTALPQQGSEPKAQSMEEQRMRTFNLSTTSTAIPHLSLDRPRDDRGECPLGAKPGFKLAKAVARASAEDRANAVEVLGADFIFEAFFEPALPL
jgi:hypothetical protein